MEGIRLWCMEKMGQRMVLAETMGTHEPTPWAKEQMKINCDASRHCTVVAAGGGEFEVKDGQLQFPVNILQGLCTCGEWQVTGLPCKHACRAIYVNAEEPLDYVHGFYTGACYKLTYAKHMHPIPDSSQWPSYQFPVCFPPVTTRASGRPAKNRRRKPDEARKGKRSTTITCSVCQTLGHNSRSCQGGPTAKEKRAAAGKRNKGKEKGKKIAVEGREKGKKIVARKGTNEASSGQKRKTTAQEDGVGTSSGQKKRKTN